MHSENIKTPVFSPLKRSRPAKRSPPPTIRASELRPHVRDLFGEVVVTRDDVRAWMLVVVLAVDVDGPRAAQYVKTYNVPGKIIAAKLAGTFDAQTTPNPGRASQFAQRLPFLA